MSSRRRRFKVGEVARLTRVSVRTLHHYDEIGLLRPSGRSAAGYRLYGEPDLERLREILAYKALGFGLEDICGLMSATPAERRIALQRQRELVAMQVERSERMIELIDATLNGMEGAGTMSRMTNDEIAELFGEHDPSRYEDEVVERWGETDAWRESTRRARSYTREDWRRFRAESEALDAAIIELIDAGVAPSDERALEAVERCRLQIDAWFYPCSRAMHAALGRMYVDDARFRATYERKRAGMAEFLRAATAANAER